MQASNETLPHDVRLRSPNLVIHCPASYPHDPTQIQLGKQVDALVPFSKALILITKLLGGDLTPSVPWLLT